MDFLNRMFSWWKTAIVNPPPTLPHMDSPVAPTSIDAHRAFLTALPAEILSEILSYLPPLSLVALTRACKLLRTHALTDSLWFRFVRENVPYQPDLQNHPVESWKQLYTSLHPYWFLTRNRLWFSDKAYTGTTMTGNLMLIRYDARRQCIEGLRVVARHGIHSFESWEWKPEVIIHTFNPHVGLYADDPIVKIDPGTYAQSDSAQEEVMMNTGYGGIRSKIALCKGLPSDLQSNAMDLWPPQVIPAKERVRTQSTNLFAGKGHRPSTASDASDSTFRIRKWVESGGVRLGEDVMTFSTVAEEYYTASREKPWQGIWVGDYSGHGCEFLLLIQRRVDRASGPPKAASGSPLRHHHDRKDPRYSPDLPVEPGADGTCAGRLEAIKLTGDPNVPRGEYTWVAEDIGPGGLLRIADENMFRGARIVRSLGHSAAHGFRNGVSSSSLSTKGILLILEKTNLHRLSLSWSVRIPLPSIGR